MAARPQGRGCERRRTRIRVAAGGASSGAAGGTEHVANVPGRQRLERIRGVVGRELLEQVGQVGGGIEAIGAGGADQGEEIRTRARTEWIVCEEPYPAPISKGSDDVLDSKRPTVYRVAV